MAATSPPKLCRTRAIKESRHKALHPDLAPPSPTAAAFGPLFSGTIHFVAVHFSTPGGTAGVSPADVDTAVKYATIVAPVVSAYASQYGPNSIVVDPNSPVETVTLQGTTYTDAQLASWVDAWAVALGIPAGDAVAVFNPQSGAENSDAPVSQGVLGYHSISPGGHPYVFVNAQGTGFTVDDAQGAYAMALSHEIQEMLVDPKADLSNPEVCDPCSGNCGPIAYIELFDANSKYLGATTTVTTAPPPGTAFAFYLNSMVAPSSATACPAPASACEYAPPGSGPTPPGPPCQQLLERAVRDIESGQVVAGIEELFSAVFCYVDSGAVGLDHVLKQFIEHVHRRR